MILIIEPLFKGYEHVEVNAALVAALRFAFPDDGITFASETEHLKLVRGRLDAEGVAGITLLPIRLLKSYDSPVGTVRPLVFSLSSLMTLARDLGATKLVFCSATFGTISAMRHAGKALAIPTSAVVHGCGPRLLELCSRGFAAPVLRWVLRRLLSGTRFFRPIVLAPHIRQAYSRLLPGIEQRLYAIDHPYFLATLPGGGTSPGGPIRFGTFGIGHRNKGTMDFFRLAAEMPAAQFIHIGPLLDLEAPQLPGLRIPDPKCPLSRADMEYYAGEIDYALFLYDTDSYQYSASGAFLDAVSYLKPVIAIRNACFNHYFNQMGNIGFLCDNYQEIKQTILTVVRGTNAELYSSQIDALCHGRSIFQPSVIAESLRKILAD